MDASDYFSALSGDRKIALEQLRELIGTVFPEAVEDMSYKIPTYTDKGLRICAIASQKHYMSLYIMNYDLLITFKSDLKGFNCGKSCIRFKKLDANTLVVFERILSYIKTHIKNSVFYKK